MRLAVPIFSNDGSIYNEADFRKPRTCVITETYEEAQKGNIFSAMTYFVAGCITSITDLGGNTVDNPIEIKKLVKEMPYITGEQFAIKIMATLNENDVIEGVYICPRCDTQHISNFDSVLDIDNRDRVSDLKINYMDPENYVNEIYVIPENPVKIFNKNTGETLITIENFTIKHPTFNDCILAGNNMRAGQEVRTQLKVYTKSLIFVNEENVDLKWVSAYGKLLFDNLEVDDIKQISDELQKYGIEKRLKKICTNCGKEWSPIINTSNFFASGLQSF
jgi:hypothetical protein